MRNRKRTISRREGELLAEILQPVCECKAPRKNETPAAAVLGPRS